MNYKLSVYVGKVVEKKGYVLEKEGRVIADLVEKYRGTSNMGSKEAKDTILKMIEKGIRASKKYLTHDDVLIIEVQDNSICEWLSGTVVNNTVKKFEEVFTIIELLESIDCRYRFCFCNPSSRDYISVKDVTKMSYGSVEDLMSSFE